jgi:hypothetical protein
VHLDLSETTAAWVQAIGSVGAILSGFAVALIQMRSTTRAAAQAVIDAHRRDRSTALGLADLAVERLARTHFAWQETEPMTRDGIISLRGTVAADGTAVASFALDRLLDADLMRRYAEFSGLLGLTTDMLMKYERLATTEGLFQNLHAECEKTLLGLRDLADQRRDEFRAECEVKPYTAF